MIWGACCESFNSKLRDELLNGEIFFGLAAAQVLIEAWRRHFNAVRPHSALKYRPPAPQFARRLVDPDAALPIPAIALAATVLFWL